MWERVTWGGRPYFSWKKLATFFSEKLATFFGHHCRFYSFHSFTRCRPLFPACKKFADPLVGAPFCGAPVRPNMLNMPKSAAESLYHFNPE